MAAYYFVSEESISYNIKTIHEDRAAAQNPVGGILFSKKSAVFE